MIKPIACLIGFFVLFLPFVLQASEFQVKIISVASDLPEEFTSQWKPGDYLISDG